MKLTVVIPAYNEESVIRPTIDLLRSELERLDGIEWRIVVSVNGTTDRTVENVEMCEDPRVSVFRAAGKGKGIAIRQAMAGEDADIMGFLDADLSTHPSAIGEAIKKIEEGADVVIGSRFHEGSLVDRSAYRSSTSMLFNMLARAIVGVSVRDTQCGFKFMNKSGREVFLETVDPTWFFDLEFIARAERGGLAIAEIPITWREFAYRGRKSKLNLVRDGIRAVAEMGKIRSRLPK